MRVNFDMLDKSEKIRIIIFALIAVITAVFAVACVWEWCGLFKEQPINTEDMNVNLDGENFNWFFMPLASGINGLIMLITAVGYVVFLFIIDLLAYGLFRAMAFRKTNFTSETEYILAKRVLTVILSISIVILLFIARFNFLILIALLIFPMWLYGYLFYILPLKHRRQK